MRSPDERRAWSDQTCNDLLRAMLREAPRELWQWEEGLSVVGAADTALMRALADWEATGEEGMKRAVVSAEVWMFDEWRRAAQRWERAGRPIPPGREEAEDA